MRRIVGISVPLQAGIASDPPGMEPEITYLDHAATVGQVLSFFGGLTREDLPDGEGWALEQVAITTHNGTHLDAPYHYASTMDGASGRSRSTRSRSSGVFSPRSSSTSATARTGRC